MGFGIMFLGEFFFWNAKVNNFDLLPDFIGYLIILYGIKCASRYCKNFHVARIAAYCGAAVSAVVFLMQGLELLGFENADLGFVRLISAANQAVRIVFIMILLLSVFSLAKQTGAEKTEKRSLISVITVPVLWLAYIMIGALAHFSVITDEKVIAAAFLCEILYVLLTAVATFSAYMWICVEGDEDMKKNNNVRTPMDYYDRRREHADAEDEEKRRRAAAEKAGKSVAEMYGVKKKKKKGR